MRLSNMLGAGTCFGVVVFFLLLASVRGLVSPAAHATGQEAADPLVETLRWMEATGSERGWLTVPPEHGRFLWLLIEATKARDVLEVGSAFGYATLWMVRGLRDRGGRLLSIELLEDRVEVAKRALEMAGVQQQVRLITGDAFEVVPQLEGQFDFIFLDAAKADYHRFYEMLLPRVRIGGMLVAHNVISRNEEVRPFLERIRRDERVISSVVQIGDDGFAVCLRRKGGEDETQPR